VPEALTTGATEASDAKASYSSRGPCLDLFAPGSNITSAWWTSPTATNTISGTSMATPHVAGVVAQYLQTAPSASPAAVAQHVLSTATPGVVGNPGTGSPNLLLFTAS
jgi:subtilisin family serine protease